jgi:hypothetical protein
MLAAAGSVRALIGASAVNRAPLRAQLGDGDVRFHFNVLVNGLEVVNEARTAPVHVLTEGMATMNVGPAFRDIESVYKEQLFKRAGGH